MLQSSKNLREMLDVIAFPAGSRGEPDKVQAQMALHMAMDWLSNFTHWNYYLRQAATVATVASTATVTCPERINSVHNMRVTTGNPRPILPYHEGLYNKTVHDQTSTGTFRYYHVAAKDQHSVITLLPTPDAAETVQIDYFRDPTKPTGLSDAIDLATWMESAVILRAQGLVSLWKGRPDHTNFLRLADADLRQALSRDHAPHDDDNRFVPGDEHGLRNTPWDHPDFNGGY